MQGYIQNVWQNLESSVGPELIYRSERFDSSRTKKLIIGVGSYLLSQGVAPNERVGLLAETTPQGLLALLGTMLVGAIPLVVDQYLPSEDMQSLLESAKLVISDRQYVGVHQRIVSLQSVIDSFVSQPSSVNIGPIFRKMDHERDVLALHTSGTTGRPKVVVYSEKNLLWACAQYKKLYDLDSHYIIGFTLPFHFCYGLIPGGLVPAYCGKRIVFMDRHNAESIAAAIQNERVQVLTATPEVYKRLSLLPDNAYDFASLRVCDSGGEGIPVSLINRFASISGLVITEGYGLTETTSLSHFMRQDSQGNLRLGSVGMPCEGVECRIVDERENDLPAHAIGELWLRGPMVMKRYDEASINNSRFNNDWFKTGDIAYRDSEGFYYILGRARILDTLPRELKKSFRELQDAVNSLDLVMDALIYPLSSEELMFIVKPVPSVQDLHLLEEMIRISVKGIFPHRLLLKFADKLPRTTSGKLKTIGF